MNKLIFVAVCALLVALAAAGHPNCGPPPNDKDPKECCDVPKPAENGILDACIAKHGKPGPPPAGPPSGPPMGPPPGCCLAECVFNATNTVTNGEINVAALKSYIKGRGSGEWGAVLEKAVEDCVAEAAAKPMPMAPPSPTGENCNPKFGFIAMCMQQKAFRNCPASIYKASAECDKLKEFSETCPVKLM